MPNKVKYLKILHKSEILALFGIFKKIDKTCKNEKTQHLIAKVNKTFQKQFLDFEFFLACFDKKMAKKKKHVFCDFLKTSDFW